MPDKPVFLTRHAKNKRRRWKFDIEDIRAALDAPEKQEPSIENRINYWHRWRAGYLRVTAVDEGDRGVIVTATPRKGLN